MKKIISFALLLIMSVFGFAACKNKPDIHETSSEGSDLPNPTATIEMKDGGIIKIELFYDKAPNTVKNFISLANSGFYDGLIFHRVIPGFMIQGGDPLGSGMGGPGYTIFGEFSNNGFKNDVLHRRGCVSMARQGNRNNPSECYNTAGSQFFICVADCSSLDNDYAAFGHCFEGMEVVDNIVSQKRDKNDKPIKDMVIKSIRVDIGDNNYGEPETLAER